MVNAPKKNFSRLPRGKYAKSTKCCTWQCHQANEGKRGFEVESVRAVGALCSLWSKKKLAAEKWSDTHFLRKAENEKWIEDYVEIETAVARDWIADAETMIQHEQDEMRNTQNTGWTTREADNACEEMMMVFGDILSDLASSDDKKAEDDENDNYTELGKLSRDDEPGCVVGTISKKILQFMERFRQKQMKRDKLTQPGWGDAADYICVREKKYGTTELKVLAVVNPRTEKVAAAAATTTFGDLMAFLDIVLRISQMQQGTSRPQSSHMGLGSRKPHRSKCILSGSPSMELD